MNLCLNSLSVHLPVYAHCNVCAVGNEGVRLNEIRVSAKQDMILSGICKECTVCIKKTSSTILISLSKQECTAVGNNSIPTFLKALFSVGSIAKYDDNRSCALVILIRDVCTSKSQKEYSLITARQIDNSLCIVISLHEISSKAAIEY